MKRLRLVLSAAAFVSAGAQAQLAPEPLSASVDPRTPSKPFEGSFQPFPRTYGGNLAANPNDTLHKGFRTDPRLVGGIELAPGLALEAGYVNGFDRGFHAIDEGRPEEVAGALATTGYSMHAAGKYTIPLGERLSAYGKLGVAQSGRKAYGQSATDTGLYTGVGARYKLSENAGIDAEVGRHGKAGSQWSNTNNADAVRARVKVGF
jgi:opacity protein-like surface antigen